MTLIIDGIPQPVVLTQADIDVIGEIYVKATYFEVVGSGTTSGTVSKPAGGGADVSFVMDEWGTATDALVTTMDAGKPTFRSPVDAGGNVITTTFDTAGNFVFSATPVPAASHAVVYVYKCFLKNFNADESIFETEIGAGGDHGLLTGLLDDDHPGYLTVGRANTWFALKDLADLGTKNHADLDLLGAPADDHTHYLTEARHDALAADNPHSVTMQQTYDAGTAPQIIVTAADGGVQIKDAATPIGVDLLEVQNNAGTVLFASGVAQNTLGIHTLPTATKTWDIGSDTELFRNVNAVQGNFVSGTNTFTRAVNSPGGVIAGRNDGPGTNTLQLGGSYYPPVSMFANVYSYLASQTARAINQGGGSIIMGSVFTYTGANDTAEILCDPYSFGSFTGGYAYTTNASNNSIASIRNSGRAAFIWAYPAVSGSGNIHEARALGDGAVLFGRTLGNGNAYLSGNGDGSLTSGIINTSGGTSIGRISAAGNGAFAVGNVTATVAGLTSQLLANGQGAFASGAVLHSSSIIAQGQGSFAQGRTTQTATITAANRGAFAQGLASQASVISSTQQGSFAQGRAVNGYAITSSGLGSFAQGSASTGNIIASGSGSVQFGAGTNAVADSLQVGSGVLVRATGQVNHQIDGFGATFGGGTDAEIWYDGTDLQIKTDKVAPSDILVTCGAEKTIEIINTVWDDLRVPGQNTRINPTKAEPAFSPWKNGLFLFRFLPGNDDDESVHFVAQLPHTYKEGTDIYPHVHWSPDNTDTGDVLWELEYSWANINSVFPAATSITVLDAGSGNVDDHLVAPFAAINGAGKLVSSVLVCRLTRLGDDGTDDYTGNAFFLEFDFHHEVNTMGSRQEFVK